MDVVFNSAIVIVGVAVGLVLIYTIARLVSTAWFKTKSEFEKPDDEGEYHGDKKDGYQENGS